MLDCTTPGVRTRESNMGNLIADIMKRELNTEVAFINGGSIRSDSTYGPGPFTLRDLMNILPFPDLVIPIKLTGAKLKEALEASVGKWPVQEGRFSQVSGIKFAFDPTKPAGSRVEWVEVNGKPLDLAQSYTAATKVFVALGNDGFDCLANGGCEMIADEESGLMLSTIVRKYFIEMRVIEAFHSYHSPESAAKGAAAKWLSHKKSEQKPQEKPQKSPPYTVNPTVEGRIVILNQTK